MRTLICLASVLLSSTVVAQDHRLTAARLDGDVLRLQTAGDPTNVRHFELPDPPRVVLDLFGIDRSLAEMPAPSSGGPAIEVRTGTHPGFLRVVVDLTGPLASYQVRQSDGLIEVGLGPAALTSSSDGMLVASSPVPGAPPRPPRPLRSEAPVVAVGVEAAPAADSSAVAEATPGAQELATTVAAGDGTNSEDLSTEELLALIDAELEAAGLDQEESAEELIEQVEAELAANRGDSATTSPPPDRRPPSVEAWRLGRPPRRSQRLPPAEGEEQLPFRYVDEEPAKDPPPPPPE